MKLAEKLVELAKKEVGVKEVGSTNRGKRVDEYKASTNLPPHAAWPWCAAFICWLVREAMQATGQRYTFKRPTTAGAWDMENWSRAQDDSTWTKKPTGGDICPGDIVIFKFSHIGLATSAPDKSGIINTVEGNTDAAGGRNGGGVLAKKRRVDQIRSRIRFRV